MYLLILSALSLLAVAALSFRFYQSSWKKGPDLFISIVIFLLATPCLIVFLLFVLYPFSSGRIDTGSGYHSGYITSVDKEGMIKSNYHVYFKTDTSSSQEDDYCIESDNDELGDIAEKYSESGEKVRLEYDTLFQLGARACHGTVIKSIEKSTN